MRRISSFALLLVLSAWASCQTAPNRPPRIFQPNQTVPCDESGTQDELDVCAFQAAQREDGALAKARKAVMAALNAHLDEQKLFNNAETKWDAFQKAQMTAVYPLAHVNGQIYGSILPMCYDRNRQSYTQAHEEELQWMHPRTNDCPASDPAGSDRALNRVYQELLVKLADDSYARRALIKAERAWIQYRDAMLTALDSVHPDKTGACHAYYTAAIAQRRAGDLKAMLHPEEGDLCYDHPISKEDLEINGIKQP